MFYMWTEEDRRNFIMVREQTMYSYSESISSDDEQSDVVTILAGSDRYEAAGWS